MEPNDDLKELRHYLYIIDGLKTRINILDVNHDYDGKISRWEYDQLVGQINRAVENYKGAVDLSVNIIRNLEVYKSHPNHVEKLIKTGNWKFKSVINPKDRYTWKELYDHLGLSDKTPLYISSLSEYIHGLSTSNLSIPNDSDSYQSIYSFGMILIERLHKNLLNTYGEEFAKENFHNLLTNPEIPVHYIKQ